MHRTIACVVAPERYRDEELALPKAALEAAGHRVLVASTRPGTATGMLGARSGVDTLISALNDSDIDAVVIAGGGGAPQHLWDHDPLIDLVRRMHAAGKPVAAICLAPPVLARAGVLAGRRATTFPSDRATLELKRGGAVVVREPVVTDGTVVTADGPEAAAEFAAAILHLLEP